MKELERFEIYNDTVKELKIKVQKNVTTYLTYSLPLCGILWNDQQYNWLYSHFFQLYTLTDTNGNFWVDYLEDRDFYKDIAEYAILDWESLKDESSITGYLEDNINTGYYVIIFLDEYYLPRNEKYQLKHSMHQLMIYGYNKAEQEFKAIAFDDRFNFTKLVYSYDQIRDAYEIGKSYYDISEPWVKKENVELIKPKFSNDLQFDCCRFLINLNDYLAGNGDVSQIRPINLQVFGNDASFNINIYDEIIRNYTLGGGDFRFFYLLSEHKEMMYKRLTFIADRFNLGGDFRELIEQYYPIGRKFFIARNLYLKQFMKEMFDNDHSGRQEITAKVVDILKWGKNEESILLARIRKLLSKSIG